MLGLWGCGWPGTPRRVALEELRSQHRQREVLGLDLSHSVNVSFLLKGLPGQVGLPGEIGALGPKVRGQEGAQENLPLLTPASTSLYFGVPGVNRDDPVIWASGVLWQGRRGDRLCACSRVPQHCPSPPSSWPGDARVPAVTAGVFDSSSPHSTLAPAVPATSPPLNLLSWGCSLLG